MPVFILAAMAGAITAQSSDRNNPTPLSSGEITGNMNDPNKESFYSFTAGPGEMTITVDVKARRDDIGVLNFELLGRNSSTPLICCEFAQGDNGGAGRDTKSIKLTKRQTVVLHTTNGPVGGGTFEVRLSGATSFVGSSSDAGGSNNAPGRGSRSGEQISVPTSGILHIRMKNGTSQDTDLSHVSDISVRQER